MNDTLMNCINEVASLGDKDKVNIRGKFYTAVDTRVDIFRKHFGQNSTITTEIVHHDLDRVVVKAIVQIKVDGEYVVVGNGFAEEFRGNGMVNKTSALENCETSAIGRALAACGLGGGAYASSFEVDNAINNKAEAKAKFQFVDTNKAVLHQTSDALVYLNHCRKHLNDPQESSCKSLYEVNKKTISLAQIDAKGETKNSYDTLISIYNDGAE